MAYLSVSVFAADFGHMARDIETAQRSGAESLHVDIMDGHFVPLIGLSSAWFTWMRDLITIPVDLHLMTRNTGTFLPTFLKENVRSISFHIESEPKDEIQRLLRQIQDSGIRRGLAISLDTPIEWIFPYLDEVDEVLIMSTPPGENGAKFAPVTFQRVHAITAMLHGANRVPVVSVDGGLDEALATQCAKCGASKIIMGRAFFRHPKPAQIVLPY